MKKEEIINRVKALHFPKNSYVVFGAAPLTILGLRDTDDIDLLVSKELLEKLKEKGWKEIKKGRKDKPLTYDVFEAHDNWNFSSYNPTLDHLLKSAKILDGVPFASIEEVRKWKEASGRPKDVDDIKLIDKMITNKNKDVKIRIKTNPNCVCTNCQCRIKPEEIKNDR
ncbi:MAG TPA: hypothetical protein VJZ93_04140 [Candidatus Nanoarchaeia archaeon]|nr:hypothetical protein [Candidatus Nanoarchaeia archaeon]